MTLTGATRNEIETKAAEAQQQVNLGAYDKAAEIYAALLAVHPDSVVVLVGLAHLSAVLGQHRDAERLALHVLELEPKNIEMWMLVGGLHEAAEDLDAAVEDYKTVLAIEPELAEAHLHLGRCLTLTGNTNDGLRHLRQAASFAPQSVDVYYALGLCYHTNQLPGAALDAFVRTIELNPSFLDGYLTIADLLAENRRWAKARNILLQAESLFPDSSLVLDKLAAVLLRMGEVEEAMDVVEKQATLESDNIRPYMNLSTLAQLAEDWPTALAAAEKLVEKAPDYWESHYHLGSVLDVLDRVEEAKTAYQKANTLAPTEWRPYNNLAYLLNDEQTPESWGNAVALLKQAVANAPDDEPLPRYNLALSLVNLNQPDEALVHCQHILSNTLPNHSVWGEVKRLYDSLTTGALEI